MMGVAATDNRCSYDRRLKLSFTLALLGLLLLRKALKMEVENKPVHHGQSSHEHKPLACEKEPPIPPTQTVPQEPSPKDEEWRTDQKKNWLRQLVPQWALVLFPPEEL